MRLLEGNVTRRAILYGLPIASLAIALLLGRYSAFPHESVAWRVAIPALSPPLHGFPVRIYRN